MPAGFIAAGTALLGAYTASQQTNAANNAASDQQQQSQNAIGAQQANFAAIQKLLAPYVSGGQSAFAAQGDLAGTNGNAAQQSAYNSVMQSPQFTSAQKLGQTAILQNASATGGLRGGNVQGALAQFAPNLLASSINDRFNQLGSLSSIGQNAAAGVGNAGTGTTNAVSGLLQGIGASQAGNALAQGNAQNGFASAITNGLGTYVGLGGLRSNSPSVNYDYTNTYNPSATMGGDQFGYKGSGSGF